MVFHQHTPVFWWSGRWTCDVKVAEWLTYCQQASHSGGFESRSRISGASEPPFSRPSLSTDVFVFYYFVLGLAISYIWTTSCKFYTYHHQPSLVKSRMTEIKWNMWFCKLLTYTKVLIKCSVAHNGVRYSRLINKPVLPTCKEDWTLPPYANSRNPQVVETDVLKHIVFWLLFRVLSRWTYLCTLFIFLYGSCLCFLY